MDQIWTKLKLELAVVVMDTFNACFYLHFLSQEEILSDGLPTETWMSLLCTLQCFQLNTF